MGVPWARKTESKVADITVSHDKHGYIDIYFPDTNILFLGYPFAHETVAYHPPIAALLKITAVLYNLKYNYK